MSVDRRVQMQWEVRLDGDKELAIGFGVAEGTWQAWFLRCGGDERWLDSGQESGKWGLQSFAVKRAKEWGRSWMGS